MNLALDDGCGAFKSPARRLINPEMGLAINRGMERLKISTGIEDSPFSMVIGVGDLKLGNGLASDAISSSMGCMFRNSLSSIDFERADSSSSLYSPVPTSPESSST